MIKSLIWWLVQTAVGHNPGHSVTFNVLGKKMRVCSRCTGMYWGTLISVPILAIFSLGEGYDFWYIFGMSWFFVLPAILDWTTVKAGLWKGDNSIRLLTGFMLGAGGMLYLFLLPAPFIYRVASLWGYSMVFAVAHYTTKCREYHLPVRGPIRQNLVAMGAIVPLSAVTCQHTGGCGQCCTVCPCADACGCCFSPCTCCICMVPMICCFKRFMDKRYGGERNEPGCW